MPDHIEYQAFSISYSKPVNKLVAPVSILPILAIDRETFHDTPVKIEALWDTGATVTCIKPALFDRLKLRFLNINNHTTLAGVGGEAAAKITYAHLFITPALELEFCPMYVVDFPSKADILIGMDIIGKGDFVVCNADNKTSFSFAIPSFPDRINLADKAEAANKHGSI